MRNKKRFAAIAKSQRLAHFAEERSRMNDLSGAVQLIGEAIELAPSFVSFYRQRAKYFFLLGKQEQTISDLHIFFKANPQNFSEVENQLRNEKLDEYSLRKPEFEALIHDMHKKVETKAVTGHGDFLKHWKNFVGQYGKFTSNTVIALDKHNQLIRKKLKDVSYADLVEIAENCQMMKEIVEVLETETKCKEEFEKLKLQIQSYQPILAELEENERRRLKALQNHKDYMARRRKLWASIVALILVPVASLGTFTIFGLLAYIIFLLVSKMSESGESFFKPLLSMVGIASVILAFIMSKRVFRSTTEAIRGFINRNIVQSRDSYEEASRELQKLRSQKLQDKDMHEYLKNKLDELSWKRSKFRPRPF